MSETEKSQVRVTNAKTAIKRRRCVLCDLKHDPPCAGFKLSKLRPTWGPSPWRHDSILEACSPQRFREDSENAVVRFISLALS